MPVASTTTSTDSERTSSIGSCGRGGPPGLPSEALDGILPASRKASRARSSIHIRGGHDLHAGDTRDLRDEAPAHLARADEADPDGVPPRPSSSSLSLDP